MASLSEEEKDLIAQCLQFYLQQASAQLPPAAVQQIMTVAKDVLEDAAIFAIRVIEER